MENYHLYTKRTPRERHQFFWLLTALPLPACPDSSTTPVLPPDYTTGVFCYRIEIKRKTFICCFWIIHQAWHALFLCPVGLLINMYRASLASFAACRRKSIQTAPENAVVIVIGAKVTINVVFFYVSRWQNIYPKRYQFQISVFTSKVTASNPVRHFQLNSAKIRFSAFDSFRRVHSREVLRKALRLSAKSSPVFLFPLSYD